MLLAIDTSGPFCSAALFDESSSNIIETRSDDIGRGHAEHLMPMLEELLEVSQCQWIDIDHVVSVTGPGSFTGVRVGIAAAKGLALGLNIRSSGVSVFQAFAQEFAAKEDLVIMLDAKRSEIWLQVLNSSGHPVREPAAVRATDAMKIIAESRDLATCNFVGAGVGLALEAGGKSQEINLINEAASPNIEAVARFAAGQSTSDDSLKPLYVRAPDAKPQSALMGN